MFCEFIQNLFLDRLGHEWLFSCSMVLSPRHLSADNKSPAAILASLTPSGQISHTRLKIDQKTNILKIYLGDIN